MLNPEQTNDFQSAIKSWRRNRRLSQLELALIADVSQRHISWLETGRSQPSRDMVIRLAEALDVPHRDRNRLLKQAGFADVYSEKALTEPEMEGVRSILQDILQHHAPYPALVIDRHWNVVMKNSGADQLLSALFDAETIENFLDDEAQINLAKLSLHPDGIRRFAKNWDSVGPLLFHRLKKETDDYSDATTAALLDELKRYLDKEEVAVVMSAPLLPVLPLQLVLGDQMLEICSVISTFGTAQDITTNELRIETFYPANEETRQFFASLSGD